MIGGLPLFPELAPVWRRPRSDRQLSAFVQAMAPEAAPAPPPRPAPARLVWIACSATKAQGADLMPARDRYAGPLWQTLRAVDAAGALAQVAFLSAQLGGGLGDDPIPSYDARLTAERGAYLAGLVGRARELRPILRPRGKAEREAAAAIRWARSAVEALRRAWLRAGRPLEAVCLVAGGAYLAPMRAALAVAQGAGWVAPDARVVVVNAPIGRMRQGLRAWLGVTPAAPAKRKRNRMPGFLRVRDVVRAVDHLAAKGAAEKEG